MRRWAARRLAAATAALAAFALPACGSHTLRTGPRVAPTLEADVAAVRAAVGAFVTGESAGDARVDTLLARTSDFVVDGVVLVHRPRLAGVPGPGAGAVTDLQIELAGDWAWAVAGYVWVGDDPAGAERGLATFVLQREPAGWRIRHVHSSHVERWSH